jgi:homoserine O-acetyltransferase
MVVGVTTDILFPIRQQQELADGLKAVVPDVEFVELDCLKGHDSFLVDMDAFRPVIGRFFETFNKQSAD